MTVGAEPSRTTVRPAEIISDVGEARRTGGMGRTDPPRDLQAVIAALAVGRHAEAEQAAQRIVDQQPDDMDALVLLGLVLCTAGAIERAALLLDGVARARPQQAHPANGLPLLLARFGRAECVVPLFRTCLALAPDNLSLRYGFAEFQRDLGGGPDEAIALLEPVVSRYPDDAGAHFQMGLALLEAGRFAEAADAFRRTIALDAPPALAWANLALTLDVEGDVDGAISAYGQALIRSPQHAQIRANRGMALLRAGRMAEAWQDEAWRFRPRAGGSQLPAEKILPPVSRLSDLRGRAVLVVHDEGFGDTLQFMRYLPLLARRGARVIVAAPAELVRVLRAIPGVASVPTADEPVPDYDFHCSFTNLPRAFATTVETIPAGAPYVAADPALAAQWARRLPADGPLRVGLVWAGATRPWLSEFGCMARHRTISLARLAPLGAIGGVRFVSLQKGAARAEVAAAGGALDLFDPMDEVTDFLDTAAIIANLDAVVSVDTSVAHLAGAMGKPVLMLDRYDTCWRWMSGRSDSPWYPTLRLFRQQRYGEWDPVIGRVAQALGEMVADSHRAH